MWIKETKGEVKERWEEIHKEEHERVFRKMRR